MMLRDAFGLSLEADWSSSRCNECSAGVIGRPISPSPVRAPWAALSLRKSCEKRCSARSNTPSVTAGAFRATTLMLDPALFHHNRPLLRAAMPPSTPSTGCLREAAENATFTLSEAACGRLGAGGHTVVWMRAQTANPLQSSLTLR